MKVKVKVKGQGQRSRSAKINIITKIPYYRSREEEKKLRLNEEARKKGHLSTNNFLNFRDKNLIKFHWVDV